MSSGKANSKKAKKGDAPAASPKPANPIGDSKTYSVRIDNAALPRKAPPKAFDSRKPPGGKPPEKS